MEHRDTAMVVHPSAAASHKLDSAKEELSNGVAVEVTCLEEAETAAAAGAKCVVVCGPRSNEISRMADPSLIEEIKEKVSIPVFAKVRVGHTVEAEILESVGVDYIDESEIEGTADQNNFIDKRRLLPPFVCGCRDLGEALRRVKEGAVMLRIQGDSSASGDIAATVRSVRKLMGEIRALIHMDEAEVSAFAERIKASYDIVSATRENRELPAVVFASGGITTPADAALMMKLGCEGVFVGKEVFGFAEPGHRIRAIVYAVSSPRNPTVLKNASRGF